MADRPHQRVRIAFMQPGFHAAFTGALDSLPSTGRVSFHSRSDQAQEVQAYLKCHCYYNNYVQSYEKHSDTYDWIVWCKQTPH